MCLRTPKIKIISSLTMKSRWTKNYIIYCIIWYMHTRKSNLFDDMWKWETTVHNRIEQYIWEMKHDLPIVSQRSDSKTHKYVHTSTQPCRKLLRLNLCESPLSADSFVCVWWWFEPTRFFSVLAPEGCHWLVSTLSLCPESANRLTWVSM